jgi:hypothetical protein
MNIAKPFVMPKVKPSSMQQYLKQMGCEAWYCLGDFYGRKISDSISDNYPLSHVGTFNKNQYGYYFDGTGDYFLGDINPKLLRTNNFSVAVKFKVPTPDASGIIFSAGIGALDSTNHDWGVRYSSSSNTVQFYLRSTSRALTNNNAITEGQTAIVICTLNNSVPTVYANGNRDTASFAFPYVANGTATKLTIGAIADGSNEFKGHIYDCMYFSKVLNPEEVRSVTNFLRNTNNG